MYEEAYLLEDTEDMLDELWEDSQETPPVWLKAFRRNKFSRRVIAQKKLRNLFKQTRRKYGVGVYFDRWKKRLVQCTINKKSIRKTHNRHFRRIHNGNLNLVAASGGSYKKFSDYKWDIW